MAVLATLALSVPLFFGGQALDFSLSEVSGRVLERRTGAPFPSPVPVTIELCRTSRECVTHARVGLDGAYVLRAIPGEYWLRVRLNGNEAWAERYLLRAGSWTHDVRAPSGRTPVAVASSEGRSESGTGGSGAEWEGIGRLEGVSLGIPMLQLDPAWKALGPVTTGADEVGGAGWWKGTQRVTRPASQIGR